MQKSGDVPVELPSERQEQTALRDTQEASALPSVSERAATSKLDALTCYRCCCTDGTGSMGASYLPTMNHTPHLMHI